MGRITFGAETKFMINIKERYKLLKRYVVYRFRAKMRGGHGIHSPFLFQYYNSVLYGKVKCSYSESPKLLFKLLQQDTTEFEPTSFGAKTTATAPLQVRHFAASSAISKADGKLLFRIAKDLKPKTVVELGTGAGVGTAYLASAYGDAKVYTVEATPQLVSKAKVNLATVGLTNVECIEGQFSAVLPMLLERIDRVDMAFIDGDHTYDATLANVECILRKAHSNTVIVVHDIHWSEQMERAWEALKLDSRISIAVDLFSLGILFLREGTAKHSIVLRY